MANERTAVITGSTGGIGWEITRILAAQGWNLVLVNRNRDKGNSQLELLRSRHPKQVFQSHIVNLIDADDVSRVVGEISQQNPQVSALYNVAGILSEHSTASPQNIEGHFAVNALAPYMLAHGLRSQLSAGSSRSRSSIVVNFSSSAIKGVKRVDVDRLLDPSNVGGLTGAYAQSKMALTIATVILADEFREQGILSLAVDPGATRTPMTRSSDGMPWFVRLLVPLFFKSADAQAEKLIQGVEAAVAGNKSGVLIVSGKCARMPSLALEPATQSNLKSALDRFVD